MKKLLLSLSIAAIFAFSPGTGSAIDWTVQGGVNYDWWKDSPDNKGWQTFVPLKIDARYQDFSVSLLSGYADTRFEPKVGESSSLSHSLDTKLNLSYEMVGKLPVDLLIGLDFNLPTGKTDLKQKDLVLIMDPDLIGVNKFGEGFDINPTLALAKEWGNWVGGIGVGYLWRDSYDFSTNSKDYHPSDIFTLTGEMRYFFSPAWSGRFFGKYAWYGEENWKVTTHREDFWKEGNFVNLGLGFQYTDKKWSTGLLLQAIFREKGKLKTEIPPFATEADIKRGNEWVADLYGKYSFDDKTALKSVFEFLFIDKNFSSPLHQPFFTGKREKYSLALGITRTLWKHLDAEAYVKGFYMHAEGGPEFPLFPDNRNFRGFSGGLLLTSRF